VAGGNMIEYAKVGEIVRDADGAVGEVVEIADGKLSPRWLKIKFGNRALWTMARCCERAKEPATNNVEGDLQQHTTAVGQNAD